MCPQEICNIKQDLIAFNRSESEVITSVTQYIETIKHNENIVGHTRVHPQLIVHLIYRDVQPVVGALECILTQVQRLGKDFFDSIYINHFSFIKQVFQVKFF